jgi:DNA ligase-associated metallophosphoesterase
MSTCAFRYHHEEFVAFPSGAAYWPAQNALLAADLHLGKAERMARNGGPLLPPFETEATLTRLLGDLAQSGAQRLILLGDSFDDDHAGHAVCEAHALPHHSAAQNLLASLCNAAEIIWITGNHDPAITGLPGQSLDEMRLAQIALRHIAGQGPDISGHYHPKLRLAGQRHPAFLIGAHHLILPAYGTYTGGLDHDKEPLRSLIPSGFAILTGQRARMIPVGARGGMQR